MSAILSFILGHVPRLALWGDGNAVVRLWGDQGSTINQFKLWGDAV